MEKIILPALSKNILLRAPLPIEKDQLLNEFYPIIDDDKVFFDIIEHYGTLKIESSGKTKRMLVAMDLSDKKIKGSIYYRIKEDRAHIIYMHVLENARKQGYGFLLLCYALFDCLENGCKYVKIPIVKNAAEFYAKFDLAPTSKKKDWKKLSFKEKVAYYKEEFRGHVFKITSKNNKKQLDQNLKKALSDN